MCSHRLISASGTPREALTAAWEQRTVHRNIELGELRLTVDDRAAFDSTLLATWPDRPLLAPVWPFARGGQLDLTLTLTWRFAPPLPLTDGALQAYRTALINANQGQIGVPAIPVRRTREGGR